MHTGTERRGCVGSISQSLADRSMLAHQEAAGPPVEAGGASPPPSPQPSRPCSAFLAPARAYCRPQSPCAAPGGARGPVPPSTAAVSFGWTSRTWAISAGSRRTAIKLFGWPRGTGAIHGNYYTVKHQLEPRTNTMSRGPGRLERAIRALFDANPDLAFVTDELCEHCYPDARPIQRKHQVAVLRAAWNVLKHDPDWTTVNVLAFAGLIVGFLLTFPPFMDLLQGK
jgi:hypothetical protein